MIKITGTGLYHPEHSVDNTALVHSYNAYVDTMRHAQPELEYSSEAFIEKASGIKKRYVLDPVGITDPERMRPHIPYRDKTGLSYQAEMSVAASKPALEMAQCNGEDMDCVIVACSNFERPYPAIAIEVQHQLNASGFAFDMNVACSSATFAIQHAYALIYSGQAQRVLVVNPEICSAHLDFKNRDCHFIFGDATTALVIEATDDKPGFAIKDIACSTSFSTNIYNSMGFLSPCIEPPIANNVFSQEGRKVFKEVIPLVVSSIKAQLDKLELSVYSIKQFWLHQANRHMNEAIVKQLLGEALDESLAPIILEEFANTSSAGSVIAMHRYQDAVLAGEYAILCSFGAGYSIGSVILQRVD